MRLTDNTDKFYALNKITAKISENFKIRFDDLLKTAKYLMVRVLLKRASINKEVVDDNMKEKSLISQRIIYDTIQSCYNGKVFKLHQNCKRLADWHIKSTSQN